jgi:hypothetical protein
MNDDVTFWGTLVAGVIGGGWLVNSFKWVFGAGSLRQQLTDIANKLEAHEALNEAVATESRADRRELWIKINMALTKDDLQGINDTLHRIQTRIDYLIRGQFPPHAP